MKVFRIGNSEVVRINHGLSLLEESYKTRMKYERMPELKEGLEYELAHIRTTKALMKDQSLQELCERCLSYFWDRLSEEGTDNPDVEWLADGMGIDEEELKILFREAGFKEEY